MVTQRSRNHAVPLWTRKGARRGPPSRLPQTPKASFVMSRHEYPLLGGKNRPVKEPDGRLGNVATAFRFGWGVSHRDRGHLRFLARRRAARYLPLVAARYVCGVLGARHQMEPIQRARRPRWCSTDRSVAARGRRSR
jgi:hypothetical protein